MKFRRSPSENAASPNAESFPGERRQGPRPGTAHATTIRPYSAMKTTLTCARDDPPADSPRVLTICLSGLFVPDVLFRPPWGISPI